MRVRVYLKFLFLVLNEQQSRLVDILQACDIKIAALEQESERSGRTIPRHARRTDDREKVRRVTN